MKSRIVLLGPPAAGKGTQAEMIKDYYKLEPTSPGAMLREELQRNTALGLEAAAFTQRGQLVPDALVTALVKTWLASHDGAFVFDGFPRTIVQADALENLLNERNIPLEQVFYFNVPEEAIRQRVSNRMSCGTCHRILAVGLHLRCHRDFCPACGGELVQRSDDNLEALEQRMVEYRAKTEPLIAYYRHRGILHELVATALPETVFAEISSVLEAA